MRWIRKHLILIPLLLLIATGCAGSSNQPRGMQDDKPGEPRYLEVWRDNITKVPVEKNGSYSNWLIDQTGIGIISPIVPWDGGALYLQKLNTRIAAGNLPDLFLPWGGIEATLIRQDAIADLAPYLQTYAPHIWESVPDRVWDVVRNADPSGQRGIYYIPKVEAYTYYGAFIRNDWLERLGLSVPETKEEYVEALRAFRDRDANGNGDPHDEIPLSGRESGRWIDHLFGMYGIAMWEGYPMWDLYDGELTYSAVTSNMKEALSFIRGLYAEGLLEQESFLNNYDDWNQLIREDRLGSWFHINKFQHARLQEIIPINPEAELAALGTPKVEGYDGFISNMQINKPAWVIANKDEQTIIDALTLLDWAANKDNIETVLLGVEGVHHQIVDNKPVLNPVDPYKMEDFIFDLYIHDLSSTMVEMELELNAVSDPVVRQTLENRDQLIRDMQPFGKDIAGNGMPASLFEDNHLIRNHSLYQEYMTKIIIGEYDLDMFDEFVEKWYLSGGEEVTAKAREWYSQLQ